jgi:BASS family bile acid:Na+ symporter
MLAELMRVTFKVALVIFMVGNLSSMGLQLKVGDALSRLRNVRFLLVSLFGCFVFSPGLAYLLTRLLPMEQPYAVGLLLLGLAPAAPFLPLVVRNGRGDLAAGAALMLLASVGTILIMPFALPFIAPGLTTSTWVIARPLVFLVLLPLSAGIIVRSRLPNFADYLYSWDKRITGIATIIFLAIVLATNYRSFIGAIGSYAFAGQLLFVGGLTVGGYVFAVGLPLAQRVVISLGVCTRNIGVAAAIVGTGGEQKVMVMLVIGTVATVVGSFAAAAWFRRRPAELIPQNSQRYLATAGRSK